MTPYGCGNGFHCRYLGKVKGDVRLSGVKGWDLEWCTYREGLGKLLGGCRVICKWGGGWLFLLLLDLEGGVSR